MQQRPITKKVAALFVRADSIYKRMPHVDAYDLARDATTYCGRLPILAHPSCRSWASLKALAKPRPGEREAAVWVVGKIRQLGGILEHPKQSDLWKECGMGRPGFRDRFGGYTLQIDQFHFGHKAQKTSWFYIIGCEPEDLPAIPHREGEPEFVVTQPGRRQVRGQLIRRRKGDEGWRRELTKAEREETPPDLAAWMAEVAMRSNRA